jgi:hypothetical protein
MTVTFRHLHIHSADYLFTSISRWTNSHTNVLFAPSCDILGSADPSYLEETVCPQRAVYQCTDKNSRCFRQLLEPVSPGALNTQEGTIHALVVLFFPA